MRLALLLPLAFLLPLVHAGSGVGDCWSQQGTGEWQLGDGSPAHTFYLDDRSYLFGNGMWLYQESNGVFTPTQRDAPPVSTSVTDEYAWAFGQGFGDAYQNLQRGGSSSIIPDDNEICNDQSPAGPDQLVF